MANENMKKQVLLIVLDGWGYREEQKFNAIKTANPKYMNSLWQEYPHALFDASGEAVGLPKGTIGTSEIGHLTIGSGRIIYTDIVKVYKAIEDDTLKDNKALNDLIQHVQQHDSTLHLMGLVSPGGVHSHQDHLYALIKVAKEKGVKKLVVHVFADGRDTAPQSGAHYVNQLHEVLNQTGIGHIATINGRYYAMDRDKNWDRTQKAMDALFEGKGEVNSGKAGEQVIREQYEKDTGDEFIQPQILLNEEGKPDVIAQNDGVFFFNFRPDRARQITKLILDKKEALNLFFVTLTEYDKSLPTTVAFPQDAIENTLSDVLSQHNVPQVHIAETEKYAHVTYFFNGGKEILHENEEFVMIPSRKDIPTHDLAPEMKAKEVADKTIEYIEKGTDFIVINFANADMVGHTGKFEPAVHAVKFEDEQIKRVTEAMLAKGGVVLITADHGNAEDMFDEKSGHPITAHSLYPVPFIITDKNVTIPAKGTLDQVAPTILKLFNLPQPKEMTGKSIL
jgi:2,3-bisphosphoglycerate-independent phosphoglycerate mutase